MRHLSLFTNVITQYLMLLCIVVAFYTKDEHDEKFIFLAPGNSQHSTEEICDNVVVDSLSTKALYIKGTFQCLFFFHAECDSNGIFLSLSTDSARVHEPLSSSRIQFFCLGAHKNIYSTQTFDGSTVK